MIPDDLRYTEAHEWVRDLGDGVVRIGITDYAQTQLGDVVFVETPDVGKTVKAGDGFAVVESVKAASDVYAPVSGEVVEANAALGDDQLLTLEQAAERLSISLGAIRRAASRGTLPVVRVGRRVRVRLADVLARGRRSAP